MSADLPDVGATRGAAPLPVRILEALYGGAPVLLDERYLLRDAIGPLLSRAQAADFAVARLRLGAVDLRAEELGALSRCRVLVERMETVTGGEALAASRSTVRGRFALLLAFLESGRVEVRVGGGRSWSPDFTVIHQVRRADGDVVPLAAALGAHYFSRPYPVAGPAVTCVLTDPASTGLLATRFDELWETAYDVGFVLAERLRRLLGGGTPRLVRERPAAPADSPVFAASAPAALPPTAALSPPAPTPAAVARLALELRFGRQIAPRSPSRVFDLAAFQKDAVARAEMALSRYGGVVLADGVGLGKTFLGLALAEAELLRGGRVVVVGPAALARDWLRPLRRLAAARGARLGGWRDPPEQISIVWLTHARLSRGGCAGAAASHPAAAGRDLAPTLVVVDEAHAFRNPATRRYRALAALCRGARVALLTATPINNRLSDLYFQLRLFAGDGAFARVGVPDLREAFLSAGEAGDPAPVLPVLREVLIRRTRPFLRDHYGAVSLPGLGTPLSFPRRAAPVPVRYSLASSFPGGMAALAAALERLTLAPYRLAEYGADAGRSAGDAGDAGDAGGVSAGGRCRAGAGGASAAAAELLRFSLLKRLESSAAAFGHSIQALLALEENFLRALGEGRLLRPRERALVACDQLVLTAVALDALPAGLDRERLAADAAADVELLRALAEARPEQPDGKLARLRELLGRPGEKVVVFTEFRDTAIQLARGLAPLRVGLVHGGGAWLGGAPIARRALIERFAPVANGAARRAHAAAGANATSPAPSRVEADGPAAAERERVDVLIATDVLSEGLNLQDARCVVSYDLPWNPVRLMQRIGRVDRLGSPHAEVAPYHFVPEHGLEALLGLLRRIQAKLALIRRTLPGEVDVLHGAGERGLGRDGALSRLLAGDAAALQAMERADAAPLEVEERLHRLWLAVRAALPADTRATAATAAPTSAGQGPESASIHLALAGAAAAGHESQPAVAAVEMPDLARERLLLCFDGPAVAWLVWEAGSPDARDDELAAAGILAAALDNAASVTVDGTLVARGVEAGRRALRARAIAPRPTARGTVALATRRLLRALAAARHRPDPRACARADLLLARLEQGVDAGTELALRRAMPGPTGACALQLIERIERALDSGRAGRASPREAADPGGGGSAVSAGEDCSAGPAADGAEVGSAEPDPWAAAWQPRAVIVACPPAGARPCAAGGARPPGLPDEASATGPAPPTCA